MSILRVNLCLWTALGLLVSVRVSADPAITTALEIPGIFSSLTGVSSRYQEMQQYFSSNLPTFPSLGQVAEVTPAFLLAELSYSSLFCKRFVQLERARAPADRWALPAIDFSRPFSQLRDLASLESLLTALALEFWGRPPTADELTTLAQEVEEWASDPADSEQLMALEPTLVDLCSAFLSSPAIWMEIR